MEWMKTLIAPVTDKMGLRKINKDEAEDSASNWKSVARSKGVDVRNSDAKHLQLSLHEKELRELQDKLEKYMKENTKLQASLNVATNELVDLKEENVYNSQRYYFMVTNAIKPYVKFMGFEFSEDDIPFTSAVGSILRDATESYTLRDEVNYLRKELQHLQGEGKTQQQQISMLQKKDLEFRNAREQLQLLKKEMLSRVETVATLPDEHFTHEFRSLVAHVRALSRTIRALPDTNLLDVLKPCGFLVDVPRHIWEPRTSRKVYIEAWIWSVLVDQIFGVPFSAFGKSGRLQAQNWRMLFEGNHFGGWPSPSSSCETWRHLTADRMLEVVGRDVITKGSIEPKALGLLSDVGHKLLEDIMSDRDGVAQTLRANLTTLCPATSLTQMPVIINKAFSLALEMALSRSRLQVTFARTGAQFKEKEMSVPDVGDDEKFDNSIVAFAVRPGFTKWGDAHGKNFEERFDIVPCEVQLESGGVQLKNGGITCEPDKMDCA